MSKKTNYNKMFEEPAVVEHFEEVVEEVAEMIEPEVAKPEIVESEPEPELDPENMQVGKVSGCAQLNVRTEPSLDAGLATDRPLKRDTEVMVYPDESTEEFYSICTESGVTGFCLKKFIAIQ